MGFALSDMTLSSSAFDRGAPIPTQHTGEGDDVSPALSWRDEPDGVRSYALICHDPDAPLVKPGNYGFVHWVLYGIPGSVTELAEGVDDYIHHYFFWLLALDADVDLEPGLTLWALLEKIEPNVVAMNRLVGTYTRS